METPSFMMKRWISAKSFLAMVSPMSNARIASDQVSGILKQYKDSFKCFENHTLDFRSYNWECLKQGNWNNYTAVDPKQLHKITYEILETNPEHGHGIPANMGGKLGDKTGDKRKTKPGRRTRHPGQRGRQDRKQEKAKTREADTASQPRQTHLTQHWESQRLKNRKPE